MIDLRCTLRNRRPEEGRLKRLCAFFLVELSLPGASLDLLVCGDLRSRALNRKFRGQDRPTDILSFPSVKGAVRRGFEGHLGDLALDLPYVERKFPRFASTLPGETATLLCHGILHLTGRHHGKTVEAARNWKLQQDLVRNSRRLWALSLFRKN